MLLYVTDIAAQEVNSKPDIFDRKSEEISDILDESKDSGKDYYDNMTHWSYDEKKHAVFFYYSPVIQYAH